MSENTRKYQDKYPYLLVHIKGFDIKPLETPYDTLQEIVINEPFHIWLPVPLVPLLHTGMFQFWYETCNQRYNIRMFIPMEVPNP